MYIAMTNQPITVLVLAGNPDSGFEPNVHPLSYAPGIELVASDWNDLRYAASNAHVVLYDATLTADTSALTVLRATVPDLPLVALVEDEYQGEVCLCAGADEYILSAELRTRAAQRLIARLAERDHLAAALDENTQRYRSLVERSNDGIALTDEAGRVIVWNREMAAITGISSEQALGDFLWNVQYRVALETERTPENLERLETAVRHTLRTGQSPWLDQLVERPLRHTDGTQRWIQTSVFVIPAGEGYMLASVSRDVTDHRRVQNNLRQLMRAIEASPTSVVITDLDGNIEYVNPRFTAVTGYTLEEVVGQNPRILKSGETPPEVYNELWQTIVSGGEWRGELLNRRKNGELYWERASITAVKDDQGKITHYIAIKEDITAVKQTQDALRASEQRFRHMFEQHPAVKLLLDSDTGEIVNANEAACRFYGYDRADLVGMHIADLNTLPETAIKDLRTRVLRDGSARFQFVHRLADGSLRDVEVYTAAIQENGRSLLYSVIHDITDRKRAEAALRASEQRFRALIGSIHDVIFTLDREQRHTGVFGRWLEIYNLTPDQLLGRTARDLLGVEEARIYEQANAQALAGQHVTYEWWVGDKCFRTSLSPLREDDNTVSGIVGIAHDVTELKETEAALRLANERLSAINRVIALAGSTLDQSTIMDTVCAELAQALDAPQVIAFLRSDDGKQASVAAEHRTGARPSMRHLTVAAADSPLDARLAWLTEPLVIADARSDPHLTPLSAAIRQYDVASTMIAPLATHDRLIGALCVISGEPRTFSPHEQALLFAAGRAVSQAIENSLLYSQMRSQNQALEEVISHRTEQLRRLNERMGAILNNAADAIVLVESDSAIENANPAFYRMFGYDTDELFMHPITALAPPDKQIRLAEALLAIYNGEKTVTLQIPAQRKDGTLFDADIALSRVDNADNDETHIVCSVRDITHLKHIERMKDRFVSMVSHELRTPTTSIVLSTHSLKTYYDRMSEEKRRDIISRLEDQAVVLADLIEGILDLSHVDSRPQPPPRHPVDMRDVVTSAVGDLQPVAEAKRQFVIVQAEDAPNTPVYGDMMDFRRIWRNLISNAIKYTPENGHIAVRLGSLQVRDGVPPAPSPAIHPASLNLPADLQSGSYLLGQVEDNGHGIPADELDNLTTRFFRGWASQSNIPGTGLGLSLVSELLHIYGGGWCVVSELGKGSAFSFWLPIVLEGGHTS